MKEKSELLMQIEELNEVKEQVRTLSNISTACDILLSYSYCKLINHIINNI